jgi:hypothetical protein
MIIALSSCTFVSIIFYCHHLICFRTSQITYIGDVMIATKVTGDRNVPRGQVTFKVNLSPLQSTTPSLQPIVLSEKAAAKWGTQKLPRYTGLGRVAEDGFSNHQWMVRLLTVNMRETFC